MSATTGTIPTYTFPEHRAGDSFGGQSFRLNRGTALLPDYIDLTGADILVQFRSSERSGVALEFTTEGDTPTITIAAEVFSLVARAGSVMNLPAGTYTADVDIATGDGNRTRFVMALPVVTDYSRRTT